MTDARGEELRELLAITRAEELGNAMEDPVEGLAGMVRLGKVRAGFLKGAEMVPLAADLVWGEEALTHE